MSTPPLMSERDEPSGGPWRDCWISAGMMACHKEGFRRFPLGWTVEEREALERATGKEPETGGNVTAFDAGTKARYGFALSPLVGSLDGFLRGPATRGAMVAGMMSEVPINLRRWQPSFAGAHMVYVEPVGNGSSVRWLDPLATWGFTGDVIPVETVLRYNKPFGPAHVRIAREHRLKLAPSARVNVAVYDASGRFLRWSTATWGAQASSAASDRTRKIAVPKGLVDVTRVVDGKYGGRDLRVDPALGVTVEVL